MAKVAFDFYHRLKCKGRVPAKLPKVISGSSEFQTLLRAKIVDKVPSGRGYYYQVSRADKFNDFYLSKFPSGDISVNTEVDNQLKYRDTKATALKKDRVVFIRSFKNITVNGKEINLQKTMEDFNIFSTVFKTLKANKICFVENLQPFLNIEKLLGEEYTYIHFYGRLPRKEVLERIECEEYLHFGDYDFVGLNEFLKAKEVFKNCNMYVPDNYEELYKEFSRTREQNDTAYKNVMRSTICDVVRIREHLKRHNRFLEQQVVMSEIV